MKYFSLFSGIGGFELGIQQAYELLQKLCIENKGQPKRTQVGNTKGQCEQLHKLGMEGLSCVGFSEIDKYAIATYQSHFGNIPRTKEEIANDLDAVKTIVSKNNYDIMKVCYVNNAKKETSFIKTTNQPVKTALENINFDGVKKILNKAGLQGENIMLCEDNECSICMGEDVSVVENLKKCSLPLNIKTEMETLTEKDMELAIVINSPLKITNQVNMKSFATTVITLRDDIIYAHIKKTKGHFNFGDITKINEQELPDFDMLVGGFPCQAFSIAGKRKGFEDTRGTLFFDIARIIKAKQPRLVFLENVKGLLSHDNGETFRTIIATLDELGYDLQWQVLNSKNFGVPQNRERVFIVGHLRGTSRPKIFPFTENNSEDIVLPTITTRVTADSNGTYVGKRSPRQIIGGSQGNRVYDTSGISVTLASQAGGLGAKTGLYAVKIKEATKKGYAEAKVGQSINLAVPNSKTRRGRVSDIAQTLDTGMQQHTLTPDMKIRRLTPKECERLQGFPDNWTVGSDTQRYKQCGNAVTVNVIRDIAERLLTPPTKS